MSMVNNDISLRVAVTGVTGRMGQEIIQCIDEDRKNLKINKRIVLGAAIVKNRSEFCGMDIRNIVKSYSEGGVVVTDDIELVKECFDVLIDFTTPEATMEYLNFCVKYHKNMVIGTTGFNEKHMSLMKTASQKIGIVYSANFSIGITVMLKLLKEIVKSVGNFFDIDIIETHHNKKRDIPSGTALMMYNVIKYNLDEIVSLYNKNNALNCPNSLQKNKTLYTILSSSGSCRDVQIHSIRSGDVIGEHTVLFSGFGERLDIVHRASNRSIFARGALYSAVWIRDKQVGWFNLDSVLGI